jgi:hypothetical protein
MAGEASDKRSRSVRRGSDGGTRVKGDRRNTGSPQWWAMAPNRRPARVGLGCWGWRTGPYGALSSALFRRVEVPLTLE